MRALPPESAAVLRPALPGIGEAILEAIRAEVPEYARPLTGTFGANVRRGVEVALRRFVESLEHPGGAPAQRGREVYVGRAAGAAVGWRLPERVAALVAAPDAARRLPADALSAADEVECLAFVPDPDGPGRRAELERAGPAALGPAVSWTEAARSLSRARAA